MPRRFHRGPAARRAFARHNIIWVFRQIAEERCVAILGHDRQAIATHKVHSVEKPVTGNATDAGMPGSEPPQRVVQVASAAANLAQHVLGQHCFKRADD